MSCNSTLKTFIVDVSDVNLKLDNGILFYNKVPFKGLLVEYYSVEDLKSVIEYVDGKKQGYERHRFKNGSLAMERFYRNGFKTGIHKAWWENGTLKFEYHFNDKGEFHGQVNEWSPSGQLYMSFNYKNGKEVGSQRLWKVDGSIKANYEVINGERFGLIGLKKCYTVTVNSDEVK